MISDKNKNIYQAWCANNEELPLFMRPYWLNAVCGNQWNVSISYSKDGEIIGVMPYLEPKGILRISKMPKQTQFLGPWIVYPSANSKNGSEPKDIISMENKILNDLIKKLPKYSFFRQKFSYRIKNWLSFYWNNFEQTTNYTYHLYLDQDEQKIFDGFRSSIRRNIRKALKNVTVSSDLSLKAFYEINKKTFTRQSILIPYSESLVKDIDMEMVARDQRKIFFAKDSDGNIHSAIYIVWDKDTCYYLWGGGDPAYRSSGATSLLMWEAIKFSKEKGLKIFDFEGSMIQPVERYVRSFGATQIPYFIVTKKSRLMKLIFGIFK